jgi:hypothetical protein
VDSTTESNVVGSNESDAFLIAQTLALSFSFSLEVKITFQITW